MQQHLTSGKGFYRRLILITLTIILQNGISTFVSLLDNIMVGQLGTMEMSGVSVVNQLMTVFYITIYGAASGATIFTAQYYGSGDHDGVRYATRFKLYFCMLLTLIAGALFAWQGDGLIRLFLQGEGSAQDAGQILHHGRIYLNCMLWGMIPFTISNTYATTLRECGKTTPPMVASICSVLVNLVLNYLLIYGKMGLPAMGVQGAALATVIARFVELAIVATWTHLHQAENPFIKGFYRSLHIPRALLRQVGVKSVPLLFNELMWSTGMAFLNQCYSTCGLDVVPALNISSTLANLAAVVCFAVGTSVSIIIGQMLGANCTREDVLSASKKCLWTGVGSGVVFGMLMLAVANLFPMLYNTTEEVRALATKLIWLTALIWLPMRAFIHPVYFAIRAGGKTFITMLFDSGFLWITMVPMAFLLSRFTDMSILWLYALCNGMEFIKCAIGYAMLNKGDWIQNLTASK